MKHKAFLHLTLRGGSGFVLIDVESIESIADCVDEHGATLQTNTGHQHFIAETSDDVRTKLIDGFKQRQANVHDRG